MGRGALAYSPATAFGAWMGQVQRRRTDLSSLSGESNPATARPQERKPIAPRGTGNQIALLRV
jgi:hypothetical protein